MSLFALASDLPHTMHKTPVMFRSGAVRKNRCRHLFRRRLGCASFVNFTTGIHFHIFHGGKEIWALKLFERHLGCILAKKTSFIHVKSLTMAVNDKKSILFRWSLLTINVKLSLYIEIT